ncbi:MAG: EamA family transporter [Ideonella sp.]|nr:EamA family transporter [Ideonella sp.]MCC7457754.1 EamA family transporter [Nitrospira sp.]
MGGTLRGEVGGAQRAVGIALLVTTSVGWGLNWPVLKLLLQQWPPLLARGSAGVAAALGIGALALARGDSLAVPRALVPRLLMAAFVNVFAWMGFSTLALQWLDAGEAALLVYTMPIWAILLAWPLHGARPNATAIVAIVLGFTGVALLLGAQGLALGAHKLAGVLLTLGAAVLFALGTVLWRSPLPLAPLVSVAWQVGLGCLPMLAWGLAFEPPRLHATSPTGWLALAYMTIVPMGVCYLSWFAALRRLPPQTASMATLLTPVVGVLSAAAALGEPLGAVRWLALLLTLGGVALALRKPS